MERNHKKICKSNIMMSVAFLGENTRASLMPDFRKCELFKLLIKQCQFPSQLL